MSADAIQIQALRTFREVAHRGSFAAAARDQGIDPSLVSRSIANLEAALGFTLFERTTRRLNLTEAGAAYLSRVSALVDELADARDQALDLISKPSGTLRVTSSTAFGSQWLVPRLRGFMELYPEISVEAVLSDSHVDIAEERIDLAIRLGPRPSGSFVGTKLMDTRYYVVATPDYLAQNGVPPEPGDLGLRQCVLLSLPAYRSSWTFRCPGSLVEIPVHGRLTLSSPTGVKAAVLSGLGPGLLASWMLENELEDGTLVDLYPEWEASAAEFDTAAWLLFPSRDYVPLKLRVLIDYLKDKAGAR
ncbi:LysR family transcriptional regulator [Qipengyuania sp. S6317L1]|uniref:LysR family transcriptional regulator n=1 Tax=Qipengyuania sp. S6317L1 TaxID=2926410 RepID=UPI001FF34051|nr:LysR family transcriptional regulator [Qipengyuania sp. S6317L1]MCK0099653.1 LysR family transcriptional regulator [Qipengyuania sp. S6317L1]